MIIICSAILRFVLVVLSYGESLRDIREIFSCNDAPNIIMLIHNNEMPKTHTAK